MGIKSVTEYERILRETKNKYPDLPVEELEEDFEVKACENLSDILSAQFTTKVYELIDSGNYEFETDK